MCVRVGDGHGAGPAADTTQDPAVARIDAFLKLGTQQGCSDIHLAVGVPPMLRMHGDIVPIKFRDLRDTELETYISEILNPSQSEQFMRGQDLDFSYVSGDGGRFRVNVYRKDTGIGAAFRAIPSDIPTLASLALPPIVTRLCDYHQGMILVTGSTGTGKSTTLAAMIDLLNSTRRLNIISLEDPIEFVHRSKMSQVIQRELGTHIPTFAEGVRAAMREDPDVILVGELRDADTIRMAMTAAETGHLVLGTLHTTSAVKTIDRLIDALPAEEREQTKSFLSQSLLAVVTQILVRKPDGHGRRAIVEVMVTTKAIAKLISSDQTYQIPSQLLMGREHGMQLFDQALQQALAAREIDADDAYLYASDKRLFQKYVTDTSMLPSLTGGGPSGGGSGNGGGSGSHPQGLPQDHEGRDGLLQPVAN
jgi:twitching motility protein PilT